VLIRRYELIFGAVSFCGAQAQGICYAGAVRGVGLKEMLHLQLLNTLRGEEDGDLMERFRERDQKSHIIVGDLRLVWGSRFWVWMKSPNFSGSRMKKTGVLFPTKSQFPSSV
jgi:hypothetical protein